jgi:hypothetical protein
MNVPVPLDPTRVQARAYRVQWRFIIDCPPNFVSRPYYYAHYMGTDDSGRPSRWSRFISQIMAIRLSRDDARETLPNIRDMLPVTTKLVDIHSLLHGHNSALTRSLFDVATVFDSAPHDLKAYIVTCFAVTPSELRAFLEARDNERVA